LQTNTYLKLLTGLIAFGLATGFYLLGVEAGSAYFVPVFLLVAPLIASLCKARTATNMLLAAWSVVVGIYAVEAALPLLNTLSSYSEKTLRNQYSAEQNRTYDFRSQLELIRDMRKQGKIIYPAFPNGGTFKRDKDGEKHVIRGPDDEILFPLGSISGVTTVFGNETGQYLVYESDEHGFHNPSGIWGLKRLDIAAIGDSYTHGASVPSNQNFVALIREQFPRTLNLGHGGSGPISELGNILEFLPARRPRLVLWFYWPGNDLNEDIHREKASPRLMGYLDDPPILQNLLLKQQAIDDTMKEYIDSRIRLPDDRKPAPDASKKMLDFLSLRSLRTRLWFILKGPKNDYETFRTVLQKAQQNVASWDGELVLVYLMQSRPDEEQREEVLEICATLGISVIDVQEAISPLDTMASRYFYPYEAHYTVEGNKAVGGVILREIQRQGLLN
jgi:hypothetical protein